MKVFKTLPLAILIASFSFAFETQAQSAKATASVGHIGILDADQYEWSTIMTQNIKTANAKDLFMDVALECGLYTQTQVKGKNGSTDSSSAKASVKVRVLIDGKQALPGQVIFCERAQELTATLGGVLESCTDADLDGTILSSECQFTDEEINLVLRTMSANSFNFILPDVSSGNHVIKVQAKIDTGNSSQSGSSSAKASIGHGSVLIEEVRMIKGEDVSF